MSEPTFAKPKINEIYETPFQKEGKIRESTPMDRRKKPQMNFFKKWGSLMVLGLALAIIIIDTTLLNVSLSTIIRELNTDIQSLQWVITAYSLTLAALTITGGRIGDLFGRKRMFVLGAVIFAIGSFIASISTSVPALLAGESIIEGIGAALMMPATASLLVANFHGKERAIAFGIWGGIAGASSAIGPILGGYLTNNYSWRWGFRINIFVTLILLIGAFLIRESRDIEEKTEIDWVGVVLSSFGLLGVVFGIIESSRYGWWWAKEDFALWGRNINIFGLSIVPFSIIIGLMFLHLFFEWEQRREARGHTPLVSLKIFLNRAFTSGVITTAIVSVAQIGLIFILPVFLQSVLELDAFNTGLALLPLSITLLITAPLSGILSSRISSKYIILLGMLVDVAAMFVLRSGIASDATVSDLRPGLILFGAGMGMVIAQVSNITLSSVSVQQAGEASGINNTMRQVGASFGSAIIGAVLLSALTSNLTSGVLNSTVIPPKLKSRFANVVSKQSSSIEFGSVPQMETQMPMPFVQEIRLIGKDAVTESTKNALLYGAFFAFLGFLAALTIPNIKKPTGISPVSH